jgi:hypothetical protein
MRPYPTATQPQFKLNHKSGGRGKCAAHGEGETPAQGGKPSAAICRQENLSEKRRARFGQRSCPRLARSVGSSANHAKQIGRTRPLFIGQTSLALPRVNRTDSHSESPRPLSHGRISPALGRPTPIQPFPNPDMDGINRHSTTTQPSFVSNPRTIPTQPSHIRDSTTPTTKQRGGFAAH